MQLSNKIDLAAGSSGGLTFDYYGPSQFEYVSLSPDADRVVIGHVTTKGWFVDAVGSIALNAGTDYSVQTTLSGTTVSVTVNGQTASSWNFNGLVVDGKAGLL